MRSRRTPKFRGHVPRSKRIKMLTTAIGLCLLGVGSIWFVIDGMLNGYVLLPTGRHSSITLFFRDGSPGIVLALLFWAAIVLFFGGGGLLLLRDALRREPRL